MDACMYASSVAGVVSCGFSASVQMASGVHVTGGDQSDESGYPHHLAVCPPSAALVPPNRRPPDRPDSDRPELGRPRPSPACDLTRSRSRSRSRCCHGSEELAGQPDHQGCHWSVPPPALRPLPHPLLLLVNTV